MEPKNTHIDSRYLRIRRTKKLLRYLPRKATLHRYPILKYIAPIARKREYLWSFRVKNVIAAFYAGWILTLSPLVGFHTIGSILLAFLLRTNIMILVGLQAISNPLFIAPLWAVEYYIGKSILIMMHCQHLIPTTPIHLNASLIKGGQAALHYLLVIALGGLIAGIILGFISVRIYKYIAKKSAQPQPSF